MIAVITFIIGFIVGWFMSSQHWRYLLMDADKAIKDSYEKLEHVLELLEKK